MPPVRTPKTESMSNSYVRYGSKKLKMSDSMNILQSSSSIPAPSTPSEPSANNSQNTINNNDEVQAQPLEEVFAVEKVLDKKLLDGIVHYKIKWSGYNDPEDDTWESIDNCHCPEAIKDYEEAHKGEEVREEWTNPSIKKAKKKSQGKKRRKQSTNHIDKVIPFVEKEKYLLDDGRQVALVLGLSKMPKNEKIMALVSYALPEGETKDELEYVPYDVIRNSENQSGKNCLIDFFESRIMFT